MAESPVLASTCGSLEVPSIIPPGTDTHSYEVSVRDADTLRSASLVVTNGLGLERGLEASLSTAEEDGVEILEVGPEMSPRADGDHDEDVVDDHDHGAVDPHVWMDPQRVAAVVPLLADALRDVGVDGTVLERCSSQYERQLEDLSVEITEILSEVPPEDRALVTNHEALGYFAERFDLEVIGTVLPSTSSLAEPNPRDLDELEATMRERDVDTIFLGADRSAVAESLADRLGEDARVVRLHVESLAPEGRAPRSYVEMMRTDAQLIADALTRS